MSESSSSPVLYSSAGAVAQVTINRPDRRNAINPEVVRGLAGALDRAESDDEVGVVVVTGAGDRSFCAGGDLGGVGGGGRVADHDARAEIGDLFKRMRSSPLPVIAKVNGHALAGGFGLMLACDLVVASVEAEMGMPEINLGLWPFMISAVVARDVPRKLALELMLTGRRFPAEEGARWGFVNRVVPFSDLDDAVAELAGVLTTKSSLVVGLGKRSFYSSEGMQFEAALAYLAGMLTLCLESEDTVEGVAAFLEKRQPQWKGR